MASDLSLEEWEDLLQVELGAVKRELRELSRARRRLLRWRRQLQRSLAYVQNHLELSSSGDEGDASVRGETSGLLFSRCCAFCCEPVGSPWCCSVPRQA